MQKFVALTNTEDVEAETTVDRLVDQLVRHAVEANMAGQRHSADSFALKAEEIRLVSTLPKTPTCLCSSLH